MDLRNQVAGVGVGVGYVAGLCHLIQIVVGVGCDDAVNGLVGAVGVGIVGVGRCRYIGACGDGLSGQSAEYVVGVGDRAAEFFAGYPVTVRIECVCVALDRGARGIFRDLGKKPVAGVVCVGCDEAVRICHGA